MCKEGFTDDTHTRCLGDSIDSDSEASYLSDLAEKAAAAAPDGTIVDKFLIFFLIIGALAIIGGVIVIYTSMVAGQPIPFVQ